jgi:uncharacterized RDD family membrane protein YckC
MQDEWWYSSGDSRKGPISLEALRRLLLDGKVSESTLVWKEGQEKWAPLSEIPDLHQVLKAIPPELPQPTAREQLLALPFAGPWHRFFARMIDLWVFGLCVATVVVFALSAYSPAFGLWFQRPSSGTALGLLLLPLILVAETGVVAIFGTTLGKAVLGVTVMTVAGQRITAAQYLKRQLGVYWYGLGLGFPFVTLFTMARQHGRLKANQQATYDQGKFDVKVRKPGLFRALFAATLLVGASAVVIALNKQTDLEEERFYRGMTWVNPVTGKSVAVPGGWIHEEQQNEHKQPVHIFTGPEHGVHVVFAKEELPPGMTFDAYLSNWISAVSGSMKLSMPGEQTYVAFLPAMTITGTMTDNRTQRVHATVVKVGQQIWRVVILAYGGREPATEHPLRLQHLLFQSIN